MSVFSLDVFKRYTGTEKHTPNVFTSCPEKKHATSSITYWRPKRRMRTITLEKVIKTTPKTSQFY